MTREHSLFRVSALTFLSAKCAACAHLDFPPSAMGLSPRNPPQAFLSPSKPLGRVVVTVWLVNRCEGAVCSTASGNKELRPRVGEGGC